ncbi:hypothetical protein [Arthrobacter sp. H14]|uniref:hypothetical protein n=1 Tax=Arthrobacter sp. H14 TaxID=1312959 RepID=UPI0004AEEDDF|nr:hypothetical protein [Arthrobacter sp. H14]
MDTRNNAIWLRKTAAAVILPFAALGLAGCGGGEDTAGPEESADVQDITEDDGVEESEAADSRYDAAYDQAFVDEMDTYVSETVTLSAKVNDDITPKFFSIAGTDDTDVEPLLVMHGEDTMDVQDGLTVKVTGTLHKALDIAALEENMGVDLNESALENWNGEPYLEAGEISVLDDN